MIKVLVAEDDPFLVNAYKDYVEKDDNIDVKVANDGVEVLEEIKKEIPSLIILDILMPKLGGPETLEELRKNPATRDIPVIIATNIEDKEVIKKCKKLGCVEYLIKSNISMEELNDHVIRHAK